MDIEENWDKLRTIRFDTNESLTGELIAPLIATIAQEIRPQLESFILGVFKVIRSAAIPEVGTTHMPPPSSRDDSGVPGPRCDVARDEPLHSHRHRLGGGLRLPPRHPA